MQRSPWFAVLAAAILAAPTAAQAGANDAPAQQPASRPKVLTVGAQVPADLKLPDIDGKEVALVQKGKIVVIHFWSSTCPWEKVAEPKINKLSDDFKGKDVVTYGIDANTKEIGERPEPATFAAKDGAAKPYQKLRKQMAKVGFNHTLLIDHSGDVTRLLGAKSTPHCFVIDGNGVLAYAGALDGDGKSAEVEASKQYVRAAVESLRDGKPVATPTSAPYG